MTAPAASTAPTVEPSTMAEGVALARVVAALDAFLPATNGLIEDLVLDLADSRKRDVHAYVARLADAVERLSKLVGAASAQAYQFTGNSGPLDQAEMTLTEASMSLSQLTESLRPARP